MENTIFAEKTFTDCLPVLPKSATPPNFKEKTFTSSHKNLEIHESFLPQKFPAVHYSMHITFIDSNRVKGIRVNDVQG